ncbi:exonuclease SbcCD subunit D [Myxococcota bacterium]|nr:exonuclease SbcCD subunit D [Myxococcota bacterium]
MRLLHSADWHLGRLFHGVSLVDDQAHLLDGFARLAAEAKIDAVLIAGDVYDRAVPPPDAVTLFDEFLAKVAGELRIPTVVIAGNHDSADRLGFGARLLAHGGLHVRGRLEATPSAIELSDEYGPIDIHAIPFVDPPHARVALEDAELKDHDACNAAILDRARAGFSPGRRQVCVAHAFVAGASMDASMDASMCASMDVEESDSERPLMVGGGGRVDASRFAGFDYVALGHLHRPQQVGSERIRYSGSLMPYSFGESKHVKSVSVIELDAKGGVEIEEISLDARRSVRVIEGKLDALLATPPEHVALEDYLLVRLTDEGALFHPMARLRERYPNVLQIERPALERVASGTVAAADSLAPRLPEDLFEDFFKAVMDREIDDTERAALLGAGAPGASAEGVS